ncbi:MAG: winged helix-turn-helix domain-containing protein [Gammaproteobacteria bacterium]|nr:helix-turn-helix domain-containing protein [Gammaproteobacteria bacterium]MDE1983875.1 winged helix-turn-helix domain-containing protein [Gammaproteobacteria bacterium]MDE2108031.1 winged helix-turn-helix domain-containing protein [Gammaproteobacteria bacterium]MDE2461166.1 winged helix-turn-helix domain-containing protein [Gammaproteobacteria bacterium]
MSRRDVANYLRLVPETVSRMFSRFVREGLIRVDGQDITLLQLARLEEIGKPRGEI